MEETHVDDENMETNDHLKIKDTILDNFRNLIKNKEKVRTKGGAHLLKYLVENEENEKEYQYALGRLIRGLGSSTENAKCGYYSVFMPLLNLTKVTVGQIFEYIDKELHKAHSSTKSEIGDICMGHILVCTAIIRSGLFLRSSEEDQKKVLDCITKASKERSYLMYPAYELLLDLDQKISGDVFKSLLLPWIIPELEKDFSEYNLDTFYFLIILWQRHPKVIGKQVLKKISEDTNLITEANLEKFSTILLSIPKIASLNHPVYELFGKLLVKTNFTVTFVNHMDMALEKYNKNKHLVMINFLNIILKNVEQPNDLPHLLEQNFITHTISLFRQIKGNEKDYQMKQLTHSLFEVIPEVLKKDNVKEKTKIAVLKKLLFHPGTFIFEKITKSKLIQQIVLTLQNDGVKKLAKIYREVVMLENQKFNSNTSVTFQNNDRLYAANLLVKLLCHRSIYEDNEWKFEQLKFIMLLGLTKQDKVGVELSSSLKDTFFRALDLNLSKLEDLSAILLQVFNELDSYQTQGLEMRSPLTEEVSETWSKAKNIIFKINSRKKKKIKLVFEILFLHLGLQLFNNPKIAQDSLEELFNCYERLKKKNENENEDDLAWIEVVVDLFLSLLSHNSSLLRKIITCVFPHLCEYINSTTIYQILRVLDPNNEDNPLTNKDDDDMSEDDDDESSIKDNEISDKEEDTDEELDEEDCSDDDDIDETHTEKLRKALQSALMQNGTNGDSESDIDIDKLDDEEGDRLNQVLSGVFKQFKPNHGKSNKQNKSEESLTHFRIRAIDLIEIYLDSNPSMLLTLEIMLPLLQLLEYCKRDNHQKPLEDRVKHCLKKLSSVKKFSNCSEVTEKMLCGLLESLLEKDARIAVILQAMGHEIAECCTFIINCSKILIANEEMPKKDKKHLKKNIVNIIKNSLDNYLRRRDCHLPNLIFKQTIQLNWEGNVEIIRYLTTVLFDEDIKPYKKSQATDLIRICFTNHRLFIACDDTFKADLTEITEQFLNKCQEFFKNFLDTKDFGNVREKFVSYLFLVMATIKNCPIELKSFDWKNLAEIVREYRSFVSFSQDTRYSFNKLCSSLGVSNIVQMKQSVTKLTNSDNVEVKSNKRQLVNGDDTKIVKKLKAGSN